jgi:glycosyltransferase involved in cell wall biosynthesis
MKIAVLFNTNQLGGAERSLVEQLAFQKSSGEEFTFFIPELSGHTHLLKDFITGKGFSTIVTYRYPIFIYELSRSQMLRSFIPVMKLPSLFLYLFHWRHLFKAFDVFYVNGNKAVLPLLACLFFFRRETKVFWHFRDFPSPRVFKKLGNSLPAILPHMKLQLIGNSESVSKSLRGCFPHYPVRTIYNLAGDLPKHHEKNELNTVGIVAMLAPWKGLHDVLLMISLFKNELLSLGYKKFIFYGGSIYHTKGVHQNYALGLKILVKKLEIEDLVTFAGEKSPQQIFSEIDVLIHSSLEPEPFGRVIVEGFKSGVPVISTGLGGAGELIEDHVTGLKYTRNEPSDLFRQLKILKTDNQLVGSLILRAHQKVLQIEDSVHRELARLFK